MELRFTLDGTVFPNPLNWQDLRIKYTRDEVVRGLFTNYTSKMDFSGSGYDYIKTQFTSGACSEIETLIEYRTGIYGSWTTLFEGIIISKSCSFDDLKCLASAPIEQAGPDATFFVNIDHEYDLSTDGDTSNMWEDLTDPFETGGGIWQTSALRATLPLVLTTTGRQKILGRRLVHIWESLVDQASGSEIEFVSSYFNTAYQEEILRIEITTVPNAGESIIVEYDDQWGHHHYYKCVRTSTSAAFLNAFENVLESSSAVFPYYREGEIWHTGRRNMGGYERFDCTIYFPISNLSITVGTGGVATASVVQSYQEGAYDTRLVASECADVDIDSLGSNMYALQEGSVQYSFKDWFDIMNKIFVLGMQFETSGGQRYLRVEPIDYFYNPVPQLTLSNIRDVTKSANESIIAKDYIFGKIDNPAYQIMRDEIEIQPHYTISTYKYNVETNYTACVGDLQDFRLPEKFIPFGGYTLYRDVCTVIPPTPQNDMESNRYFVTADSTRVIKQFMSVVDAVAGGAILAYYRVAYYDIPNKLGQIYFRQRELMPEHYYPQRLIEHEFDSGGNYNYTRTVGTQLIADGAFFNPIIWTFNHFVTKDQWSAIVQSSQITVNQGNDPLNDVNAFIVEVEHRVFDGYTTFKLEAKS